MMVIMDEANRAPRCSEPGCPVRYRFGADRLCRDHRPDDDDTTTGRMSRYADVMVTTPGEHDGDTKGEA